MTTTRRFITSGEGLPQWLSPISHAVVVDRTCYLSGQLALDAQGQLVPGDAGDQARLAFRNLFCALKAAGFTPQDLVFVDIAFTDLADMPAVNAVYAELFEPDRRPARTVYQAAALPFGGRVKVMGTAVKAESCEG
ncbi:RidA family protein [Variovorax sp. J22R133]|uniref:RidA family protein n=1 Tax=Variovorax brevis TaxID=3053503 RepID=UPI002574DCC2|nr:RidA family protein [Variovorax sp. J22R133]MDM0116486.1 RidA family protein [Variovorax sp. J22R133]